MEKAPSGVIGLETALGVVIEALVKPGYISLMKLLELMNDVPDDQRQARFVSVITLCFENGDVLTARGECPGRVLRQPAGTGGFGYDPLFLPDGCEETFAQLSGEQKNLISHRARALSALGEQLAVYGNEEIKEQQ